MFFNNKLLLTDGAVTLRDGQELDYETGDKYMLNITVYDGHNHTDPETLTILVEDVNEAPRFSLSRYYISTHEGSVSFYLIINSLFIHVCGY